MTDSFSFSSYVLFSTSQFYFFHQARPVQSPIPRITSHVAAIIYTVDYTYTLFCSALYSSMNKAVRKMGLNFCRVVSCHHVHLCRVIVNLLVILYNYILSNSSAITNAELVNTRRHGW